MANAKPYYTTDDLIASIKRRISFPLSQNTFQYSDLVAFLNEEMQLSAVPTVKQEHEEYFVYKVTVPLVNGVSRYEIPNRAIGMALRDVKYSDSSGNFYDMTRIAPDDKAFFQQSNGSNQTISKYYIEGNEIVLTPLVQAGAVGKLNFFIYLRPNSLVKNDRAATIQNFQKDITVSNNANLEVGDKIYINTGNNTSPTPEQYIFTAVTGNPQTVFSINEDGTITTNYAHGLNVGGSLALTLTGLSGAIPNISGETVSVVSTGAKTLKIENKSFSATPPEYTFTVTAANATAGATYTNNGNTFTVLNTISGSTVLVTTGLKNPLASGTLTKASGTGDATIAFSSYSLLTYNGYIFTTSAANATAGDIYKNSNNETFEILETITGGATLTSKGTISTVASGTLTKLSGTGDATITFSTNSSTIVTGGSYSVFNQFKVGVNANASASNLNTAINAVNIKNITSTVLTNAVTVTYSDISTYFTSVKPDTALLGDAFSIDSANLYVKFDQLPTTYTDPETMQQSLLYGVGHLVDFLQTNPGHRTYTYDIPLVSINGTVAAFAVSDLQTYLNNSSGGTLAFYNIKVGDYICLANECIIPQIPPELHNALAERAASRVLMAIGDVQGYQVSQAKLAEMNKMQETLIGSRIEGSVPKVFNRYSLLRLGKSRFRRRY